MFCDVKKRINFLYFKLQIGFCGNRLFPCFYNSFSPTSMNAQSTSSAAIMGDENQEQLESNSEIMNPPNENILATENEENDAFSNQIRNSQNINTDSLYYIYHPPKYALPPYQDPKLGALNLTDQIKVICSYHNLISKSIANQAKIQIDSCSYPEPISTLVGRNDTGGNDNSDEYVCRSGRITKRKYYSEADPKDSTSNDKETNKDEPTKKKAALTPTRNKNAKLKQAKSDSLDLESKNTKSSSSYERQNKESDGFAQPAPPTAPRRAARRTVMCPLCGVHFPEKEVEQHASSCGDIVEDNNINISSMIGYNCQSCSRVLSTLEEYEIHITECSGGPSNV